MQLFHQKRRVYQPLCNQQYHGNNCADISWPRATVVHRMCLSGTTGSVWPGYRVVTRGAHGHAMLHVHAGRSWRQRSISCGVPPMQPTHPHVPQRVWAAHRPASGLPRLICQASCRAWHLACRVYRTTLTITRRRRRHTNKKAMTMSLNTGTSLPLILVSDSSHAHQRTLAPKLLAVVVGP